MARYTQSPDEAFIRQDDQAEKVTKILNGNISANLVYLSEYAMQSANIYAPKGHYDSVCSVEEQRFNIEGWEEFPINLDALLASLKPSGRRKTSGLGVEVWMKKVDKKPILASIVFRGTDFTQFGDWASNLHWFYKFIPWTWDQYDQTRAIVPEIVKALKNKYPEDLEIVATGHSLGGGLAQQAGYISPEINVVYAFNPSLVTGYWSVLKKAREKNSKGIRIYRVYEHGEVLAYLRLAMKAFYTFNPKPNIDPKVVEIRLNLTTGSGLEQHNMKDLACGLHSYKQETLAP